MPQISVIVPVYKVEPYIHSCVDSILEQTYTDFELILVDDGSPDNCGAICDEYAKKDNRIKVIHKSNEGAASARNVGLKCARGDYIAFIDSDDAVAPVYIERLYDMITENDADISSIGKSIDFSDKETVGSLSPVCCDSVEVISGREACFSIYNMDDKVSIVPWGKLYKKKLFDEIKYPVGMICEDDATTPKLYFLSDKVAINRDKTYFYRQQPNSVMHRKFTEKRFDGVRAVDICIDFFQQRNEDEIVRLAKRSRLVIQSKIVIQAYKANAKDEIPKKYKMTKLRALRNIYRYASDDTFTWYLSQIWPHIEKPYSYFRKIKQIFGLNR